MDLDSVFRDSLDVMHEGPDPHVLRLGLLVPLSGPLGLTGPSALDAAALAADELNQGGGVRGRRVELVVADAGGRPSDVGRAARSLVGGGLVHAVVGLHTSDVHRAVEAALAGRVPYIFTPPHEGGARLPGVVLLGDSPLQQLSGAMSWLARRRDVRSWALLGSDYIWTWAVHSAVRPLIRALGADVVLERLVPFGLKDEGAADLVSGVARVNADAILLSLIGSDQAVFNRAFARSPAASHVVRLSGALEENGLLAAGGDDTGELYAAMRSFSGQQEPRRLALNERYRSVFGPHAPVLDAYSEGCYDGVHLAAALERFGALNAPAAQRAATQLLRDGHSSTVREAWAGAPLGPAPLQGFLARADGLDLAVVQTA